MLFVRRETLCRLQVGLTASVEVQKPVRAPWWELLGALAEVPTNGSAVRDSSSSEMKTKMLDGRGDSR